MSEQRAVHMPEMAAELVAEIGEALTGRDDADPEEIALWMIAGILDALRGVKGADAVQIYLALVPGDDGEEIGKVRAQVGYGHRKVDDAEDS